jgi:hypothetical protein
MTSSTSSTSPPLADLLLAEAVRAYEQDGAKPIDAPAAAAVARNDGGPELADRVLRRAAALPQAEGLTRSLHAVRQSIGWLVLCALVLAAVAGAGAARGALGGAAGSGASPVNFFWILSSLLGVQTLLLAGWIVLVIMRPRAVNVSPLGGLVIATGRGLARRLDAGRARLAATEAVSGVFGRGPVGRWTFSAISHALWVSANTACILLLVLLLSTRNYTFVWETTILTSDAYERITEALAAGPRLAGFRTPTAEQIAASRQGAAADEAAARAWSGLLVGAMVVYGLAPRALLCAGSLVARRRAIRRLRLDTERPGYQVLRAVLFPPEPSEAVDDDEGAPPPAPRSAGDDTARPGAGPPALIGLEIEPPSTGWPPRLHGVRFNDLGFVDGRADQQRVLEQLRSAEEAPCVTIVVCGLTATPDRGVGAFLADARAAGGALAVVLTGGHDLRTRVRAERVEQRAEDWRGLAHAAGADPQRVLEIDLEHLTEASQARLVELVGRGEAATIPDPPRRLEETFALIRSAAASWPAVPGEREQGDLHRRIAEVHGATAGSWRARLGLPEKLSADVAGDLLTSARRFGDLLPERLRKSPRWLAAGGLAGALGCVAAAALVSPVAIGALPVWSAIGAAVTAVLAPTGKTDPEELADETAYDRAIRAATLWAILLELQGGSGTAGEAYISRMLDAALPDEHAPLHAEQVPAWLDDVRHRFDVALTAELNA